MNIMLVDDDPVVLRVCTALLEHQGHHVRPYGNSIGALASLTPDLDLVICDANMRERDGFELASSVAASLGSSPPKTLLYSASAPGKDLEDTAPEVVIGLLSKPVRASVLWEVMEVLAETRNCCPGIVASLCPLARPSQDPGGMPCHTSRYAACARYRSDCGASFRRWLAEQQQRDSWPPGQLAV